MKYITGIQCKPVGIKLKWSSAVLAWPSNLAERGSCINKHFMSLILTSNIWRPRVPRLWIFYYIDFKYRMRCQMRVHVTFEFWEVFMISVLIIVRLLHVWKFILSRLRLFKCFFEKVCTQCSNPRCRHYCSIPSVLFLKRAIGWHPWVPAFTHTMR